MYYDPEKALRESTALYDLLKAQENDLKSMEEPPDRKLHYDKYFYINRSRDAEYSSEAGFPHTISLEM